MVSIFGQGPRFVTARAQNAGAFLLPFRILDNIIYEANMAANPNERSTDAVMDAAALYREEIYTDRKVGTLRVLMPVKRDGSADAGRKTVYAGEAQIMTNAGPLPISFEIEAGSLEDAAKKFAGAAKEAIERTMRELQELRRQAASTIVVPQGGMGGIGPGGVPGGGKIQLP
jgi:hypothetical protein